MASVRHTFGVDPSWAVLEATRDSILAVGWRRTTLTDVARRAGISRMTIYRRWPDVRSLVGELVTREWASLAPARDGGTSHRDLAASVTATVRALRGNALFQKIVEVDPELLLPYLLQRRGRTHDALLGSLEAAVGAGQRDGSVRAGDPVLLARSVLLAAQGFALSASTMTGPPQGDGRDAADADPSYDDLDAELQRLVERYLAP
jgi:AcrR family transcriptional regulator